jgi:hypothetical protein
MRTVRKWSQALGNPPRRYHSQRSKYTKEKIALIVDLFDADIVQDTNLHTLTKKEARKRIDDIIKVILRWWSGCMAMAKTIALETRDGPNTPTKRKRLAKKIYNIAKHDRIFADGVLAAVAFKNLRSQKFSLDGINVSMQRKLGIEYI